MIDNSEVQSSIQKDQNTLWWKYGTLSELSELLQPSTSLVQFLDGMQPFHWSVVTLLFGKELQQPQWLPLPLLKLSMKFLNRTK